MSTAREPVAVALFAGCAALASCSAGDPVTITLCPTLDRDAIESVELIVYRSGGFLDADTPEGTYKEDVDHDEGATFELVYPVPRNGGVYSDTLHVSIGGIDASDQLQARATLGGDTLYSGAPVVFGSAATLSLCPPGSSSSSSGGGSSSSGGGSSTSSSTSSGGTSSGGTSSGSSGGSTSSSGASCFPDAGWTANAVAVVGDTIHNAIAVDSKGTAHILFVDDDTHTLQYRARKTGAWTNATAVDTTPYAGYYVSVAVDSGDGVHAAYLNVNDDTVYYTHANAAGVWDGFVVPQEGAVAPLGTAIAVTSDHTISIFYENNAGVLRRAYNKPPDPWAFEDVNTSGARPAVSVDASDQLHLVYYSQTQTKAVYGTYTSSWDFETLSDYDAGGIPSIFVDATDTVHLTPGSLVDLEYLRRPTGDGWTGDPIAGVNPQAASMVVDTLGTVHVVYYEKSTKDLIYARLPAGSSWIRMTITQTDLVGRYPHLALGPDGALHLSYHDDNDGTLYYATHCP